MFCSGRSAPKVLEVGFGNGAALRFAAQHEPTYDYIGIEVYAPGVGRLLNGLRCRMEIVMCVLYHYDAVEVLNKEIVDGALDEIRIYFPDPWHKKRHHKRRLIQPLFATLLVRKLRVGGCLHMATDWADCAEQTVGCACMPRHVVNRAGPCVAKCLAPIGEFRRALRGVAKYGHRVWTSALRSGHEFCHWDHYIITPWILL